MSVQRRQFAIPVSVAAWVAFALWLAFDSLLPQTEMRPLAGILFFSKLGYMIFSAPKVENLAYASGRDTYFFDDFSFLGGVRPSKSLFGSFRKAPRRNRCTG